MKVVCGVCVAAESKYKCPSCITPYCSLACYQLHKATCHTRSTEPSSSSSAEPSSLGFTPLPESRQVIPAVSVESLVFPTADQLPRPIRPPPPLRHDQGGSGKEKEAAAAAAGEEDEDEDEEQLHRLTLDEMKKIAYSDEIRAALYHDSSLREIIRSIDAKERPQDLLDKALMVPHFSRFADLLLETTGCRQSQPPQQ